MQLYKISIQVNESNLMYSRFKKKTKNTPIYFNTNYRTKVNSTNHHGLLSTSV